MIADIALLYLGGILATLHAIRRAENWMVFLVNVLLWPAVVLFLLVEQAMERRS